MSGHKHTTITLSQEEYRKLHEAEMRLRFMNERIPDIIHETRNEINNQLQNEFEAVHFRQEALLECLEQVNLDIIDFEHNSSQNLIDQQHALHQGIADVLDNYQIETERSLATMEIQVQSQLDDLLSSHSHEWRWMMSEWQRQATDNKQKSILADEWLHAATLLDQFIQDHYDHNFFAPGAVNRLETRLIQAHNNLTQNLPEAAIVAAQQVYNDFSELRITLENKQNKYQLLIKRVNLKILGLRESFSQSKVVPAIDLDGNALPYNINVDYWCEGKLSTLEQEFEHVIGDTFESANTPSFESMHNLIDEYFPCVEDQISNFTFDARMKVINAQLRMNIAEIVVHSLFGQGYALDNSYFLTGDERAAYQANLFNYEGSQVVVKIDPLSDQEVSNELHLYTSDAQAKTAHELKQRALEIRRALQSSGLQVGTILANRTSPDPAIFEYETTPSSVNHGSDQNTIIKEASTKRPSKLEIRRQ